MTARTVPVPPERLPRWTGTFGSRHGEVAATVADGALVLRAADGAVAEVRLPFDRAYDGPADPAALAAAAAPPDRWGLLLVRKGGFAVARLAGAAGPEESKVGRRHVQGRTKAGGQSQQRFARRREQQARQAYEAAADHAARLLAGPARAPLAALVCGGDRRAVEEVLADPRLAAVAAVRCGPWLPVPDPRRDVLDRAVLDARSLSVTVTDPA